MNTPSAIVVVLALFLLAAGLAADVCLFIRARRSPPDWKFLIKQLQSRPWTWREGGVILLILALLHQLALLCVKASQNLYPAAATDDGMFTMLLLQTLLFDGVGFAVIVSLMRSRNLCWGEAFGFSRSGLFKSALQGAFFYLAAMPAVVCCGLIYRLILFGIGYPVEPQYVARIFIEPLGPAWVRFSLGAAALTIAPLVEELFFRGIALPLICRHVNMFLSVCFVSLLFAVVHSHVPSIGPLFAIAVAFSFAYLYSGSMLAPIVMHILFNGVSLTAFLLLEL